MRRLLEERQRSFLGGKNITGTANCLNNRGAAPLDFFPQTTDMNINNVRARIEVISPNRLKKHGSSDQLTRVAHEISEQFELGWEKRNESPLVS